MGRWAARYAEKLTAPPQGSTDKTDERGVLSVLAVPQEGGANDLQARPSPVDLDAVAWSDADMARFTDRRTRLMRWGWAEADAERQAEKLVLRDREADPRVSCTECQHYRPGRCSNHKAAALASHEVGRDLAARLQRCPGFQDPRKREATT